MEEKKSKSQLKREMKALQRLGERLVELPEPHIKRLKMPAELEEAVIEAKEIKRHEARRRHMQYIGAIMRTVDPAPIAEALDRVAAGHDAAGRAFKETEALREELLAGDDGDIEALIRRHPGADRKKLRQLVRAARKERAEEKPPKSYRALFRYLTQLLS